MAAPPPTLTANCTVPGACGGTVAFSTPAWTTVAATCGGSCPSRPTCFAPAPPLALLGLVLQC